MPKSIIFAICATAILDGGLARAGEAFIDQPSFGQAMGMIRADMRKLARTTIAAPTAVPARNPSTTGAASGIQNSAQLEQIGSHNSGFITQTGTGNSAVVVQHGSGNLAMITQTSRAR